MPRLSSVPDSGTEVAPGIGGGAGGGRLPPPPVSAPPPPEGVLGAVTGRPPVEECPPCNHASPSGSRPASSPIEAIGEPVAATRGPPTGAVGSTGMLSNVAIGGSVATTGGMISSETEANRGGAAGEELVEGGADGDAP